MKNLKFYVCPHCGNQVEMVLDAGVSPVCCGQNMMELHPNTVEASGEKHIPVVTVEQDAVEVRVGSVEHPMTQEHLIQWVCLQTETGVQRKWLEPGQAPVVRFRLTGEKPVAVYAWCNLHGLWKQELN